MLKLGMYKVTTSRLERINWWANYLDIKNITGHPGKWDAEILTNSIFEQRASSYVLNSSIGGV